MIGLLFIVGWGGLFLLTFILVTVFMSRPWHIGERIACSVMTLLIGLGIPFWDYIPAKMYFNDVCKSAGVIILSDSAHGLKVSSDLDIKGDPLSLDWNVRGTIFTVSKRTDGELVAVLKAYSIDDGRNGFVKPWMSDSCPHPSEGTAHYIRSGQVVINNLNKILNEDKK